MQSIENKVDALYGLDTQRLQFRGVVLSVRNAGWNSNCEIRVLNERKVVKITPIHRFFFRKNSPVQIKYKHWMSRPRARNFGRILLVSGQNLKDNRVIVNKFSTMLLKHKERQLVVTPLLKNVKYPRKGNFSFPYVETRSFFLPRSLQRLNSTRLLGFRGFSSSLIFFYSSLLQNGLCFFSSQALVFVRNFVLLFLFKNYKFIGRRQRSVKRKLCFVSKYLLISRRRFVFLSSKRGLGVVHFPAIVRNFSYVFVSSAGVFIAFAFQKTLLERKNLFSQFLNYPGFVRNWLTKSWKDSRVVLRSKI